MKEIEIAKQTRAILQQTPAFAMRFAEDLKWLEERVKTWQTNRIRVGVIGVTSSGKSTLINAIIQEELLPVAVRPSSGRLVTCVKEADRRATIYFEDGHVNIFMGKSLSRETITEIADEAKNPNNRKGVKHVELATPNCMLSKGITLVDSPGLEAYGLERHDELSLRVLLPTVDVCIFVTTMKVNSDETTYQVLKVVREMGKPLVIVQNMLDSIVPKLGYRGEVVKPVGQIANEHRDRVLKIAVRAGYDEKVPLVQVSAKHAVQSINSRDTSLLRRSQIKSLVATVEQAVRDLMPRLYQQRYNQLRRHVVGIVKSEESVLKALGRQIDFTSETNLLDQIEREIGSAESAAKNSITGAVSALSEGLDTLQAALVSKTAKDFTSIMKNNTVTPPNRISSRFSPLQKTLDSIESARCDEQKFQIAISAMQSMVSGYEAVISDAVRLLGGMLAEACLELNIVIEDILATKIPQVAAKPEVKKKLEEHQVQVEKEGIIAWFLRLFGSEKGFRIEQITREVIDNQETHRALANYRENVKQAYKGLLDSWARQMACLKAECLAKIQARRDSLQKKKQDAVEFEQLAAIVHRLKALYGLDAPHTTPANPPHHGVASDVPQTPKLTPILVDRGTLAVYELAHDLRRQLCGAVYNRCVEPKRRVTVWGWDVESVVSFATRYCRITMGSKDHEDLEGKGTFSFGHVRLVYENEHTKAHIKSLNLRGSFSTIETFFILLDVMQIGAAEKHLKSSPVHELLKHSETNFVAQSFCDIIIGGAVNEAVSILAELKATTGRPGGILLINDPNPLYTIVLLALQEKHMNTISDETSLLTEITARLGPLISREDQKIVEQLVRSYCEITRKQGESRAG